MLFGSLYELLLLKERNFFFVEVLFSGNKGWFLLIECVYLNDLIWLWEILKL